jgi:RNA polymerase sigma-70 factor (ECF subfamily)
MTPRSTFPRSAAPRASTAPRASIAPLSQRPTFDELYGAYVECLWRNARRLGVADDAIDDVLQQVFMVLHRRLPEVQMVGSWKSWLIGVLIRVVKDHKRLLRRKSPHHATTTADLEGLIDDRVRQPEDSVALGQAANLVQRWLDQLPENLRIVFVLAELEHLSAVEIGAATNTNPRTVYSRLRTARRRFEVAAAKHRQGG